MAIGAGYLAAVSVSTNDSSYSAVGGLDSVSYDFGREEYDTSAFSETAASAIQGRKEFSGSASGKFNNADAGQAAVIAHVATGGDLYVKVLSDGTNGFKCKVLAKYKVSASVSDAGKFEFSWRQIAAPTAVP